MSLVHVIFVDSAAKVDSNHFMFADHFVNVGIGIVRGCDGLCVPLINVLHAYLSFDMMTASALVYRD
ncbi:hypothetical protein HanRHA438_Chr17g0828021 [Helianthus annuus]|nr:hypothetical protein HanRHA438_Chr17g0828021 [Helianthus annuus]